MHKAIILQFFRYIVVGVMNTLVTLAAIFVCKSLLGLGLILSNVIGYVLGVTNAFIWNKKWVFRSNKSYLWEIFKFVMGFAACYALQFLTVFSIAYSSFGQQQWSIWGWFVISGYGIATIIGNIVYTLANFIYNRLFTFK